MKTSIRIMNYESTVTKSNPELIKKVVSESLCCRWWDSKDIKITVWASFVDDMIWNIHEKSL